MQKIQPRLTVALFFTTLVVLTYFGLTLVSAPIDFLYRNTAGLSTARDIAQIVALLATLLLFITGLIIAVPTALQPGNLLQKLINVLPIYFLGFLLAGVAACLLNIGAVGTLFTLPQIGPINFIQTWLILGAILSTIGVVIAAGRARLGDRVLRSAGLTTAGAMVLSLVAAVAVIAAAVILSGAQASFGGGFPGGNGGGQGGGFPGGNGAVSAQEASNNFGGFGGVASTQEAPSGFGGQNQNNAPVAPNATQEVGAAGQQGRNRQGQGSGFRGGNDQGAPQGGPAGFPGGGPGGAGPGGFGNNIKTNFEIGAALMAIFAVLSLISVVSAFRVMPYGATGNVLPKISVRREVGLAFVSVIVLTIIFGVIIQFAPTTRDNPTPVQAQVKWDSTQTETLATDACLDCHSNQTRWTWYSYIAPMSFLTTMHVHDAREELNFSELDSMPEFRKSMLADMIAMEIRSDMMPPKDYRLLHPEANLTDTQKQQLIDGWQKTLALTFGSSS